MKRSSLQTMILGVAFVGIACWLLMFAAAHDLWHDTGKVDLATIPGVSPADLRAFVVTFYLLPLFFIATMILNFVDIVRSRRHPGW